MTREEAVQLLWRVVDLFGVEHATVSPGSHLLWMECMITAEDIEAFNMAIAALRGPEPDPDTGLVPCGCGGVTEQTDFHDGFFPHSKVECLECGIEIMRAGNIIAEAHDEAKMAWNTAMGWKGGSEELGGRK